MYWCDWNTIFTWEIALLIIFQSKPNQKFIFVYFMLHFFYPNQIHAWLNDKSSISWQFARHDFRIANKTSTDLLHYVFFICCKKNWLIQFAEFCTWSCIFRLFAGKHIFAFWINIVQLNQFSLHSAKFLEFLWGTKLQDQKSWEQKTSGELHWGNKALRIFKLLDQK